MRGFLAGVIWGGVVAGAGLAVISQVAPLPGGDVAPAPQAMAEPDPAPLPKAPEAEPQPEILQKGPENDVVAAEEAEAEAVGDAPAPEEPAALEESPVATDLPPETPAPGTPAPADVQPVDPPQETILTQPSDVPTAEPAAPVQPALPEAQGQLPEALADALPGLAAPASPDLPEAEPAPSADAQGLPPAPDDPLLRAETPQEDPAPAITAPQPDPEPEAGPEATVTAPGLEPAPGLAKSVPGVTTDRLPRIGTEAGEGMPQDEDPAPELAEAPVGGATPLDLFARAFENPEGKPLFSVILIDDGVAPEDRGNLAALPFPVTFAIDPLAPDSAEAARVYRQAGQEVAMLATGIPEGATATDLEQTMQALDLALPEAVVVLDAPDGGLQAEPDLARQLVPIVAAQGRGLLTYDRGLNPADQVARREGVPSATIFRILDSEGESIPKMRNYLDRAAFKAAQEGKVLVIGRAHPETVAALLEWTVEGRAATVAMAPVSAVLERVPSP